MKDEAAARRQANEKLLESVGSKLSMSSCYNSAFVSPPDVAHNPGFS
jgi:hypothetical protein